MGCWAVFLGAVPGLLRLRIDNSAEAFFVRDAVAVERYERLEATFADPEIVRLTVTGEGLWSREGLEWLHDLELKASRVPGVVAVAGLWGNHGHRFSDWPPQDPAMFRSEVLTAPVDVGAGWVNAAGTTVSVMVVLARLDRAGREELLMNMDRLLAEAPAGAETAVTGLPVVNTALDAAFVQGAVWVLPPLTLLAVVLMGSLLRSVADVVRPLAMIAFCEVVLFGMIGYTQDAFGSSLNVVSMVVAPLTLVLTLATVLHVLLRFRGHRRRGLDGCSAVLRTYSQKGRPVLWAGLTTGVGFGSLVLSTLPPVRWTGAWLALGIGILTTSMFTLFPALLAEFEAGGSRNELASFEARARSWGRLLAGAAVKNRGFVLACFGVVLALAVLGFGRVEVETDLLSYFRSEHPVRREIERLELERVATVSAHLVIALDDAAAGVPGAFGRSPFRDRLTALTGDLRFDPDIYGVLSSADLSPEGATSEGGILETGRSLLESADKSAVRIWLQTPMWGMNRMAKLYEEVERLGRASFPEADVWLTGRYPLVIEAQRTLVRTLMTSITLTLLCVVAAFVWLLGDLHLALLAVLPNLWPVAGVVGAMGWLGISLEGPTVMLAAVALGLAVDDTLHFVGEFRRLHGDGRPAAEAVIATEERLAGAQVLTSLVLAAGFGACALSSFVPVARFAALMVLAVAMALAADLLLMPALFAGMRSAESSVRG
ncbi:MAG: RND family transporter [Thermoanaerobaculia bacterium]